MPEQMPLDERPLTRPALQRLPADEPGRDRILAAHTRAVEAGESMYPDPVTGLYVLTARYLAERGTCCGRGCRHCPYVRDLAADAAADVVAAAAEAAAEGETGAAGDEASA